MAGRHLAMAAGLLVLVTGCRARRAAQEPDAGSPPAPAAAAPQAETALKSAAQGATTPGGTESGVAAMVAARKLIRTAQVTVEVKSWDEAAGRLASIVESSGGYVADTRLSRGEGDGRRGTITARVPADRFGAVLTELRGLGIVESETVSAQDITKAYTDLETRLTVKRETGERLRQILKDRTAALADVLAVERELSRVTEETEQMEGERRFYDQQVALSTLTFTLHEPEPIGRRGAIAPLAEALRDSAEVMSRSVAALVYLLAFALPWAVVAFVVWRLARLIGRRRRAEKPPAA